jgi:hypothetical protein
MPTTPRWMPRSSRRRWAARCACSTCARTARRGIRKVRLDAAGNVTAWDYEARGFSGQLRPSGTDVAGDSLAGQLIGGFKPKSHDEHKFSEESYGFPAKRKVSHLLPWEQSLGTGMRTAHFRDPDGPQTCFASESFADEVAYAAGIDPVEFRLRYLEEPREKAVVEAAARKAGWQPHAKPRRATHGGLLVGHGLAYAPRHGTMVAVVAEVAVEPATGRYRVRRFTVAHDCGFVVNPRSLNGTIEANLMQAMSRAMHEAVRFDPTRVRSVDWITYPIIDMMEVPDALDIVIVGNKPGAKTYGAGDRQRPPRRHRRAGSPRAVHPRCRAGGDEGVKPGTDHLSRRRKWGQVTFSWDRSRARPTEKSNLTPFPTPAGSSPRGRPWPTCRLRP